MSAGWEGLAHTLVADLQVIFAGRLLSVTAYGPSFDEHVSSRLTSVALVTTLTHEDLDACARLVRHWTRAGIATPLILPDEEFRRSLDTFPLEYAEMMASHVLVFGRDPFDGITIDPNDIRRACEKQVKSHLLHLREGYIEAHGDPLAIAQLVADSAPSFGALLRGVARLLNAQATSSDLAAAGARATGLPEHVVVQVLSLGHTGSRSADGARLFQDYLTAVEHLAHAVDTWRP